MKPEEMVTDHPLKHRLKTGVPGLDKLMDGGIPRGYSALVAGPSGSRKIVLSNQFIVEGITRHRQAHPCCSRRTRRGGIDVVARAQPSSSGKLTRILGWFAHLRTREAGRERSSIRTFPRPCVPLRYA